MLIGDLASFLLLFFLLSILPGNGPLALPVITIARLAAKKLEENKKERELCIGENEK